MTLKESGAGPEALSLEARVALFKAAQSEARAQQPQPPRGAGVAGSRVSSTGSQSIFGEKGPSRRSRHPGAKARLAASYYAPSAAGGATAFSMSSSAMERNAGLSGLDERFEKVRCSSVALCGPR